MRLLLLFCLLVGFALCRTYTGSRSLLSGKFNVTWNLDEDTQRISFKCDVKTVRKWIGIGFSQDSSVLMKFGAYLVVTFDADEQLTPRLQTYYGKEKNTRPDGPVAKYGNLDAYSVDEANGITSVTISRTLAIEAGSEKVNYAIADGVSHLLVAFGNNNTFGYHHDDRDAVAVNFWDPQVTFPSLSSKTAKFGTWSNADKSFTMNYFLDTAVSQTITIQLIAKTTGWFGIGLNPASTASMQNAAFTICSYDGQNAAIQSYFATEPTGAPKFGPLNPAFSTAVSGHYNAIDKTSSVTFTHALQSNAQYDKSIENGDMNVIWGYSKDNTRTLNYHSNNRGGFQINFLGGGGGGDVASTVFLYTHGICMTLAWAFFAALGIVLARFTKNLMPLWWMRWHIIVFVLCIIFTIAGFVTALGLKGWTLSFSNPHTVIGFIIFLGSFLQPIIGVIADRMFNPQRTHAPVFPDQIHWYIGRVLWLTGLLNIYLGLELVGAHFLLKTAYFFWVAFLIAVFVFQPKPDDSHHAIAYAEQEERKKLINTGNM